MLGGQRAKVGYLTTNQLRITAFRLAQPKYVDKSFLPLGIRSPAGNAHLVGRVLELEYLEDARCKLIGVAEEYADISQPGRL